MNSVEDAINEMIADSLSDFRDEFVIDGVSEIKDEIRDDIRDEIVQEVRDEVMLEIKESLKNLVQREVQQSLGLVLTKEVATLEENPSEVKIDVFDLTILFNPETKVGRIVQGFARGGEENTHLDMLESLILAHVCSGIDVTNSTYLSGVQTSLDALDNNWNRPK